MNRRHSAPAGLYALVEQAPGTVLLEFAEQGGASPQARLFANPLRVLVATVPADLAWIFDEIERAVGAGCYAAGYFSYECGEFFEPTAGNRARKAASPSSEPLAWFGIYAEAQTVDCCAGGASSIHSPMVSGKEWESRTPVESGFRMTEAEYAARIGDVHRFIRSGDVYQLNFTVPIEVRARVRPATLYEVLRLRQPAPYCAFLHTEPGMRVLSLSPELFFEVRTQGEARRITTRPMKGTAGRGRTMSEDRAQGEWLASDPKNRAENVMIVDLLRNDLGRLCEFGSVAASDLFAVERYPTLWQMTSTVTGKLRPEVGFRQIFRALFPCGSITGAPKVRAMQLIGELEGRARGVYTGAIGFFSRAESIFNVAIRTLCLNGDDGVTGVGSGVVIDSEASAEWDECRLKAEFLTGNTRHPERTEFSLVETLLWEEGYPLLSLHLDRLGDSAAYFDFPFCREEVQGALLAYGRGMAPGRHKVRALLDGHGRLAINSEAVPFPGDRPLRVRISTQRIDSEDPFHFHKTTHRPVYSVVLKAAVEAGYDEVLFLNERGEVTEGAIHNVFVERDGRLVTPPVECGVLAGVQRRHILATKPNVVEGILLLDDLRLADGVYLCNAVRGTRRAEIDWGPLNDFGESASQRE